MCDVEYPLWLLLSRGLPGIGSGLMGILESLLQTQLGVFVFSNFVIACCTAVAAVTMVRGAAVTTYEACDHSPHAAFP